MAAPNIDVAVIHANGANGSSKSFTRSGFGTPKAMICFAVKTTAADGSFDDAADCAFSFGVYDGTSQSAVGVELTDGDANAATARIANSDKCLVIPNTNLSGRRWHGTASWTTDGVSITFAGDATDYEIIVILLTGSDLSAKVGTHAPNTTQNATATTSSIGFEPHLLVMGGNGGSFGTSSSPSSAAIASFGVAHNGSGGITQRGLLHSLSVQGASSANPDQIIETDRVGGQVYNGSIAYTVEITGFASGQFTSTTRDGGSGGDDFFYLALASANDQDDFEVGTVAAQTGSGTQTFGSAFQPQGIFGAITCLQTTGSLGASGSNEQSGFFASDGGGETRCHLSLVDDGAATMTCGGKASTNLMSINHIASGVGTSLKEGSFDSFASGGGTVIDWAGASTFTHYGFFVNIKGADLAGGTTYEDSISLGVSAGYSLGNAVVFEDAVTMAVSAGVSQGNAAVMEDDATFAVSAGMTPSETVDMQDAVTLGASMGLSTSGGLLIEDSVSLGVSAGYSLANTMDAGEAVSLGVSVGAGLDGDVVIEAAISLGVSAGISLADAGNIIEESVTFAVTAGASASSGLIAAESVALAVDMGLGSTDNLTAEESVALSVSVGAQLTIDSGFLPAWAVASKGVIF